MSKRILPADAYDTLELSAMAFGGIGRGKFYDYDGAPVCMLGHRAFSVVGEEEEAEWTALGARVIGPHVTGLDSDRAVRAINTRSGSVDSYARVPFAEWCAELGVERGS